MFDGHLEALVHCLDEFLGQRGGPTAEHTDAAEIVFVDCRMFPKQKDYRRDDVRIRYLLILNNSTKFLNFELGHHDQREPTVETLTY